MERTTARLAADLQTHFGELPDYRTGNAQLHNAIDIITIAICGVICGANHWTEVEMYGQEKAEWLGTFLELPHGIPSHDTFGRFFRNLDPEAFETHFREWTSAVQTATEGQVWAIDGKCLRRSHDQKLGKHAIYMVSAWATEQHLVWAQRKVDEKSNEITAVPELLSLLDLKGCIVSIDAMGTQKNIAAQVRAQGGDYMLALKDNQPHLFEDVQSLFTWAANIDFAELEYDYAHTVNKGHGRIEVRECWIITDPTCLAMLADLAAWVDLHMVIRIRAQRHIAGHRSQEDRYYISSCSYHGAGTAAQALHAVRSHWGIENQVHWVLDMAFREDECRVRKGHGDENFAVLRHIALNILRRDSATSVGIRGKRLKAGWNNRHLEKLLLS